MKFIPSQLAYAVVFHLIKLHVEHEQHSWVTGLYWTLVVMSTLGFGDITFTSDTGRIFSIVVLLSGVVFLPAGPPPQTRLRDEGRIHRRAPHFEPTEAKIRELLEMGVDKARELYGATAGGTGTPFTSSYRLSQ